ncbi:putative salivary secreted peptide [Lycorma delicatula]|uniref:putative salivary secreted peptide n=1 Tax=Lycorma delicatula TaxID=130591 RepID=UPI003F515E0B
MEFTKAMTTKMIVLFGLAVMIPLAFGEYKFHPAFLHHHDRNGSTNGTHHDLIIGNLTSGDRLLYHSGVVAAGRPNKTFTYDLQFPAYGYNNLTISYLKVIDLLGNGKNGYPSLKAGGVGYNYTVVSFKSQKGFGLNFNVTIFGNVKHHNITLH